MLQFSDKARLRRIKGIARRERRLGKIERGNAVGRVAEILKTGEPTLFRYEADCRHKLRARMCMDGISWARADATAAEIVAEALALIGAERPSWAEGQRIYTEEGASEIHHTHCARCNGKIPPQRISPLGNAVRYCSDVCRDAARSARRWHGGFRLSRAEFLAAQAVRRQEKRETHARACEGCQKEFLPDLRNLDQRFCSMACVVKAPRPSMRRPARNCEMCGEVFQPKSKARRFCSRSCASRDRVQRGRAGTFSRVAGISASSHPGPDRGVHYVGCGE